MVEATTLYAANPLDPAYRHLTCARQEPTKSGQAGRRVSVLGGRGGQRVERETAAYVSSIRDREIVVVNLSGAADGNDPHPGQRPTEQDDAQRRPDAAVSSPRTSRIRLT